MIVHHQQPGSPPGAMVADGERSLTLPSVMELISGRHGDFFVPRGDLFAQQIRLHGAHARPEIAFARSFVGRDDVVIDVGAHLGTFSVPFGLTVGAGGRVVAIEPNPMSHSLLQMNVTLNGLDRIIRPMAAALDRSATDRRIVARKSRNSGFVALEAVEAHSADAPVAADDGEPRITTTTLDQMWAAQGDDRPVNLIKIDVEGMEGAVVDGARVLIADDRPVVYMEVSRDQCEAIGEPVEAPIEYLHHLGYRFARNRGERNAPNDHYEIEVLGFDQVMALIEPETLFDLACVPEEKGALLDR